MWGAEDGESGGFRFNFGGDADAAAAKAPNPDIAARAPDDADPKEGGHIAGVEVLASSVPEHSPTWKPETLELDPSTTVVKGAVTSADAANALSDADGSIDGNSDVVKGRYEGGFKLWECSVDLAKHLLKHADVGDDVDDDAGGACVCAGSPSAFFPVRAVLRVFVEGHEGAVLHRKCGQVPRGFLRHRRVERGAWWDRGQG